MADSIPGSGSARSRHTGYGSPVPGHTGGGFVPSFDQSFDSGSLHVLRARAQALAVLAGMPQSRAGEVVLAVHELAANAVRHGAGPGRLRVWSAAGALHCQVDDGDPPAGQAAVNPFPYLPGHGLWVVRQVADQVQILSGPGGTSVTITFGMPGLPRHLPLQ